LQAASDTAGEGSENTEIGKARHDNGKFVDLALAPHQMRGEEPEPMLAEEVVGPTIPIAILVKGGYWIGSKVGWRRHERDRWLGCRKEIHRRGGATLDTWLQRTVFTGRRPNPRAKAIVLRSRRHDGGNWPNTAVQARIDHLFADPATLIRKWITVGQYSTLPAARPQRLTEYGFSPKA
jgi:hypothetical protein